MDEIITGLNQILSSASSAYVEVGNPEFYPYTVPSSAEYPYVVLDDTSASTWDTLGNTESGYDVPFRFVTMGKDTAGGTKKVTEITNTIESLLNKNHFDVNDGNVIFCKTESKSKPLESPQERGYFWQYLDIRIMIERS